jgi:hypothetical protein
MFNHEQYVLTGIDRNNLNIGMLRMPYPENFVGKCLSYCFNTGKIQFYKPELFQSGHAFFGFIQSKVKDKDLTL